MFSVTSLFVVIVILCAPGCLADPLDAIPQVFIGSLSQFKIDVVDSREVNVVLFTSKKCPSCRAFDSIWTKLVNTVPGIVYHIVMTAGVNGRDIYDSTLASENGLPAVIMYTQPSGDISGKVLVQGWDVVDLEDVQRLVKKGVAGYARDVQDPKSFYMKA